jgi:hypothetical protein
LSKAETERISLAQVAVGLPFHVPRALVPTPAQPEPLRVEQDRAIFESSFRLVYHSDRYNATQLKHNTFDKPSER